MTCQVNTLQDLTMTRVPGHVTNASKGDLMMSPGSFDGHIGALLAALDPPQHYTHCGIFVDDGYHVRHVTMMRKFGSGDEIFYRGSILGQPAPTSGFDDDAVRFGWPGTITQSVEEAWVSDRLDHDVNERKAALLLPPAQADAAIEQMRKYDPVTKKPRTINALSFDPVTVQAPDPARPGQVRDETYPALVVHPCYQAELALPWVRDRLHDVADAALTLAGHYRFYAYSDASIAFDAKYDGPPMLESEVSDGRCNNKIPVTSTKAMMCSSFIWTALRHAALTASMVVDDERDRPPSPWPCQPLIRAPRGGDLTTMQGQINGVFANGLYEWPEAERLKAGQALYDKITKDVSDTVAGQKSLVLKSLALSPQVQPFVAAFLDAIIATPIGSLAALGLSAGQLNALRQLGNLPDTVATQILNSFANDNASSASWKQPGNGRTAGPDSIIWSWDEPREDDTHTARCLWGDNDSLNYAPPTKSLLPSLWWEVSEGPGTAQVL